MIVQTLQHENGDRPPKTLHVYESHSDRMNKPAVFTADSLEKNVSNKRQKRDSNASSDKGEINKNITTKVNHLFDSHAQLMVHWLGEGTNVMICLAREPPLGPLEDPKSMPPPAPSSVYFSFDYGDTFVDKTLAFNISIDGKEQNSTLDQIVFTDPRNKAIFTNSDYGKTIVRQMLDFTPSEISFYEQDAKTFLVLDKQDPDRKLYFTTNFGETFTLLQTNVKSIVWSSGDGLPIHLYIERKEPTNTSSVIFMNASDLLKNQPQKYNLLIENVQDFHIKKDFMFATRKVLNNTQLHISYKRGRFVKADFQTELEIKGIHIADVEGKRIMASGIHSDIVSHLYVSESNSDLTDIKFVPSLENIFSYVPDVTWKTSWLVQTSDEAFTELYKVEGMRGIYIASKVSRITSGLLKMFGSVGPEHLSSLITFDHGATWKPIVAPTHDEEGQKLNCTDCTLHLSQKFSQLYPVTRSVTIMSSKSAPGVIMATGVVGKSLKGHACVFISRDAGQTWKQILKTYHFFNYGDHGGVLVAVKYFKSKGETNQILYSIDEGEQFLSHPFHTTDLKVYGLMTEPNTNTTTFTLFGSEPSEHRWLIVKIDLKNAFEYNCTEDDYKFWSPGSKTRDSLVPCQLGLLETYQRRAAHSKCYNGKDYQRQMRTEVCSCNSWDFECDFGFSRLNSKSPCIRNKTQTTYDPYKVPDTCKPGDFYNRTKGYRLIEGDVCVDGFQSQYLPQETPCPIGQPNDFLVVAQRDKISRIEIPSGKKEVLPINGLKNVIAIEFDMKHNCVFWADIMTDEIGRQCLNGNQSAEILLEIELASVEGMSYDWVSELLFFVDGTRLKIEALKTSTNAKDKVGMRKTIIDTVNLSKPRGIVVHPIEGYLFWTDWSQIKPSISRSNLDGSEIRVLYQKPHVIWPNGITIDYIAERVYWVDASKDYIASCDLHGRAFKTILDQDSRVAHPFAVGVYKDLMYWDDWKMNSVFSADKDHGIMINVVADSMPSLMDLKVYAHSIQSGTNACAPSNNCSHICVGAPNKSFTCLCPNEMLMSPNGDCLCPGSTQPFANKTCPQLENTCSSGFYTCGNKLCVPMLFRCDGQDDCGDNSDETGCPTSKQQCPPHMFSCVSDSKCIPDYFLCDHDRDCSDGSDEAECKFDECKSTEFKCNNGRCINRKWLCDTEDDCRDSSDEMNCNKTDVTALTCKSDEFRCGNGLCIANAWRCDQDQDCTDGSDELNCDKRECDPWMFNCGDGRCIYQTWKCDGDYDCHNKADEENCNVTSSTNVPHLPDLIIPTCHDWMFRCQNERCVPYWWKCDGINDCGDNSDELGCANVSPSNSSDETVTTLPPVKECSTNEFTCDSGLCISKPQLCDGINHCPNGEDEKYCPGENLCGKDFFRCRSDGVCLSLDKHCNGVKNCVDGSDEDDCTKKPISPSTDDIPIPCRRGFFMCDNTCFPESKRCDNKTDCYDGSDEENCNGTSKVYQVGYLFPYKRTLNSSSFLVFWYMQGNDRKPFEYLPSISKVGSKKWTNHTSWIEHTEFRFTNLTAFTTYNVQVYVRVKGTEHVDPPYLSINVTTAEGMPQEPLNVNVTQLNGSRVQVSWDPPKEVFGILKEYTVYYGIQSPNVSPVNSVKVSPADRSIVLESNFEANSTYNFWVRARNSKNESPPSTLVRLAFNDVTSIDRLSGLQTTNVGSDFIDLKWNAIKDVDGYIVQPSLPPPYPKIPSTRTTNTTLRLENLVPGAHFTIKVSAYQNKYYGRQSSIYVVLRGKALPEVTGVSIYHTEHQTRLRWNKPETDLANLTYGVYYGTTLDEMYDEVRQTTQATNISLIYLRPCHSYLISVGIIGPKGPGPLSREPLSLATNIKEDSPPRSIRATVDTNTKDLIVIWEHSCPFADKYPGYVINITELTFNTTSIIELKPSRSKVLMHTFDKIEDGAVLDISIATSTGSEWTTKRVYAPRLPAPTQLRVWPERNGTYVVYWKEVSGRRYTYELLIVPGLEINGTKPLLTIESKSPPILVNPSDLGGADAALKIFTLGVRLKSVHGFHSDIHEIEHIEIQPDAWMSTIAVSSAPTTWLVIISILIVISLVVVVVFLVQRHRRLAHSFSRFANSHYDTKTGATRLGALDDDEPNHPHSVEDDEPLVIA
ncbi:hypothetical protein HA402_015117 [Bradysia odoriphaga]|nr:hypothetical protein HA402_015117 [Bradysia odoriphaga]